MGYCTRAELAETRKLALRVLNKIADTFKTEVGEFLGNPSVTIAPYIFASLKPEHLDTVIRAQSTAKANGRKLLTFKGTVDGRLRSMSQAHTEQVEIKAYSRKECAKIIHSPV